MATQPERAGKIIPLKTPGSNARQFAEQTSGGKSKLFGGTGGPSPPGGVDVEIATLKTHIGYIAKGLAGVAGIGLVAFGWIFYNIYQPMNSLEKDSAVQTEILNGIRGDLQEIKDELKR